MVRPSGAALTVWATSAMGLSKLKSDRLGEYLNTLTPTTAAFLIREVERDRLRGGRSMPHDLILERAREVIRQAGIKVGRHVSLQRMFCEPFTGLLADRTSEDKVKGRIARSSANRVWIWLEDELATDALRQLAAKLPPDGTSDAQAGIERLSAELYDLCSKHLSAALEGISHGSKSYSRLAAQLGDDLVLENALEIRHCMSCGSALVGHLAQMPSPMQALTASDVELYADWYQAFAASYPEQAYVLLASLVSRGMPPPELLKVVVKIVGSDEAEIVARHAAGAVVGVLLHDMEITAERAREEVIAGTSIDCTQLLLAEYHNAANALCDAFELDLRGAWGNRLVTMRSRLSSAIRERISAAPRLIKSALFQRMGRRDLVRRSSERPDPRTIEEAEFSVNLLMQLRLYLDQLALNADFARVRPEVERFLEVISERLLRGLRDEADDIRAFATAGYPVAGRLLEAVFDKESSELYLRRARAALDDMSERESDCA